MTPCATKGTHKTVLLSPPIFEVNPLVLVTKQAQRLIGGKLPSASYQSLPMCACQSVYTVYTPSIFIIYAYTYMYIYAYRYISIHL